MSVQNAVGQHVCTGSSVSPSAGKQTRQRGWGVGSLVETIACVHTLLSHSHCFCVCVQVAQRHRGKDSYHQPLVVIRQQAERGGQTWSGDTAAHGVLKLPLNPFTLLCRASAVPPSLSPAFQVTRDQDEGQLCLPRDQVVQLRALLRRAWKSVT